VSYQERQRLEDIQAAIDAIRSHIARGGLSDGLVFGAVRIRLLEIGEAVKALPDDLLATQPQIPWRQIAGVRDYLAHRYFDTAHRHPPGHRRRGPPTAGTSGHQADPRPPQRPTSRPRPSLNNQPPRRQGSTTCLSQREYLLFGCRGLRPKSYREMSLPR